MPGCPNGADPTPEAAGLQKLLDISALTASLLTLFKAHAPTSVAAFTASLVDVNSLCALNPDPPKQLTALDFVTNLVYGVPGGASTLDPVVVYIYEWLRYQAFTQFCVCRAIVPDPTLNCFHATNISIPAGDQQIVPLPTVTIEPAVYNSWTTTPSGDMRYYANAGKVTGSPPPTAQNWFVQVQGTNGVWTDLIRGDAFPEGTHGDFSTSIQNGHVVLPPTAPMRIRSSFGGAGVLTSLDLCFRPAPSAPQPLPPDPSVPGLPTVPAPICSTDDLCSIVQELSRALARVGGQVSDIQAQLGTTDVYETISTVPIVGENQVDVVLGTRAVRVRLTTLGPTVFTSALGRPRGLMRAGSVRWGTSVGFTPRVFIDGEDWTIARPQGALSVSYQLLEGTSGHLEFLR